MIDRYISRSAATATTYDHIWHDRADQTSVVCHVFDHQRLHAYRMTTRLEHFVGVEFFLRQKFIVIFHFKLGIVASVFEAFFIVVVVVKC